jgi:predicted GNAT family N-acyltransferase
MTSGAAGSAAQAAAGPPAVPAPDALALGADLGISPDLRHVRGPDLDPATAAALAALRSTVGPDDDRADDDRADDAVDRAAATEHVWRPDASGPVAYLRLRPDGADLVVERVSVRADVRQLGLATALLADVVARHGGVPLVADVPVELTTAFSRFGFRPVAGAPVVLDGATAMRRAPDAPWREP